MPSIRKVSADEASAWVKDKSTGSSGVRAETRKMYDQIIAENIGEVGVELTLTENEKVLTVKNNLIAAAKRANVGLKFLRAAKGAGKTSVKAQFVPVNEGDSESSEDTTEA